MSEENSKILAHLPYLKVTRFIEENIQNQKEEEHMMKLSTNGIKTSFDNFSLEEILDISYRDFSQQMGLLYLHTTKGLYSYTIRINPQIFIMQFKKIKQTKKFGTNST